MATSIVGFCRQILEGGSLDDKLVGDVLAKDDADAVAVDIDVPARSGALVMKDGAEKLPALNELGKDDARVACLSRFAHHELMAVEFFAWALLRFPQAPPALRRGLWAALVEEQGHLRLYLQRLEAHGARFGDEPLSGYFWKLMPAIRNAADPLKSFLSVQGLTLEQANLDFTILFRDAFNNVGDVESGAVMQRVHTDEIAHVKLARTWLCRDLGAAGAAAATAEAESDVDAYLRHVPFPLSPARAKGRRFEVTPRRKAGLSEAFIELVRVARPYATKSG